MIRIALSLALLGQPGPTAEVVVDGRTFRVPEGFVVEKVAGQYLVFINDGELPRLRLGRAYVDIVRDKKNEMRTRRCEGTLVR